MRSSQVGHVHLWTARNAQGLRPQRTATAGLFFGGHVVHLVWALCLDADTGACTEARCPNRLLSMAGHVRETGVSLMPVSTGGCIQGLPCAQRLSGLGLGAWESFRSLHIVHTRTLCAAAKTWQSSVLHYVALLPVACCSVASSLKIAASLLLHALHCCLNMQWGASVTADAHADALLHRLLWDLFCIGPSHLVCRTMVLCLECLVRCAQTLLMQQQWWAQHLLFCVSGLTLHCPQRCMHGCLLDTLDGCFVCLA